MTNTKSVQPEASAKGGIQDEYSFDYKKAKRNRFVGKIGQDQLMVCLDAEVDLHSKLPNPIIVCNGLLSPLCQ